MVRNYPQHLHQRIPFIKIFLTGMLVGTFDITCALIQYYLLTNKDPRLVFNYISSALYGADAYSGGTKMIVLGVALHYSVALLSTFFFYLIYQPLQLYKLPRIVLGILFGAFIWCMMNLLVVPMTHAKQGPFTLKGVSQSMGILIVAIGIPLAFIAYSQLSRREIMK